MDIQLFAICRENDTIRIKRVNMTSDVQTSVFTMFDDQRNSFLSEDPQEIIFDGGFKADEDEILVLDADRISEYRVLKDALSINSPAIEPITPQNFEQLNVKALFVGVGTPNRSDVILIQRFVRSQILTKSLSIKKLAMIGHGDTFNQLSDPVISFANSLTCIIEDQKFKFKSFSNLRTIFDLNEIYRNATDSEIHKFAQNNIIQIDSVDDFIDSANQSIRKLIYLIQNNRILDNSTIEDIQSEANRTKISVEIQDNKIIMPNSSKEIKDLLQFLNEGRFVGGLSGSIYVANSKRRISE